MPAKCLETDECTLQRMMNVRTFSTPIEESVRSILHRMGYRFSLKRKGLPGKPDILLPKYHTAVFVHGCFWHGHTECRKGTTRPKRNSEFWSNKLEYNIQKDERVENELQALGWKVMVIWECELVNRPKLESRISEELEKR